MGRNIGCTMFGKVKHVVWSCYRYHVGYSINGELRKKRKCVTSSIT